MSEQRLSIAARTGQCILLLLLAGLLIGRRDFAHLNLGDLWRAINQTPPSILNYAFVTELTLLALLPLAFFSAKSLYRTERTFQPYRSSVTIFLTAFGWVSVLALALIAFAAGHAIFAVVNKADSYLIARQSALALIYPLSFLYAIVFFGRSKSDIQFAVWGAITVALVCAALDAFHILGPKPFPPGTPPTGEEPMPIYGLETLPLAILGLGFVVISTSSWPLRFVALLGMGLAVWRQSARPMQSVVPVSLAGSLLVFFLIGLITRSRTNQRESYTRAVFCLAFFGALAGGYFVVKSFALRPPAAETQEIKAWNVSEYSRLMNVYNEAQLPDELAARNIAVRPPYERVDDPEAYKLHAVFLATPNVSVRNNMWRFLVWRRMLSDWRDEKTLTGAGVGKPWFYRSLYPTGFHYGDDREGLDPHNSYINLLYRYGVAGLALVVLIVLATLGLAVKALRGLGSNTLLEGLLLYFAYTAIFAFFTVALEGPAYSLPFWITLGLIRARASQMLNGSRIIPHPVAAPSSSPERDLPDLMRNAG